MTMRNFTWQTQTAMIHTTMQTIAVAPITTMGVAVPPTHLPVDSRDPTRRK